MFEFNISNESYWDRGDSRWCYVAGIPHVCVRISMVVLLGMVTGGICLARVIQFHCHRAKNYHQYAVYYIAMLICFLSIVHWAYLVTPILDLLITYLIVVQMLVISWFFCSWAFRILQRETLFKYLILPCLLIALLYYTAFLIWASIQMRQEDKECTAPQWLMFTSSHLIHVQLFLISVIYITKKLNDIRTMKTNRCSQKAQLWGLAVMYEVVSVAVFAFDIYMVVTKNCGDNSVVGTIMFIVHKTIKYFVPQLTICVVFAPLKRRTPAIHQEIEETDVLSHMDTPNYRSTFYDANANQGTDSVVPYSIHGTINSNPILPRTISSSSSYQSAPWLVPGRSVGNKPPSFMEKINQSPTKS